MRQMSFEGGFQGRTNKLFDGCYSFWVGGIFPLIQKFLSKKGEPTTFPLCIKIMNTFALPYIEMNLGGFFISCT